ASHVDGRIKIETDTIKSIVVGTGKNGKLKKTVVATTSTDPTVFIAEYFDQPNPGAAAMGVDITHICNMQYWELVRESGTADATLSLYWDDANCGPMSLMAALTVARYDTVEWVSAGNTDISGDPYNGSVTSDTLSAYGCFTYGCNHNSLKTSGEYDNFPGTTETIEEASAQMMSQIEIEQNTTVPVYDLDMVVLPNPSKGKMNVTIKSKGEEEVLVVVQDMLGRVHYSKVIFPDKGEYHLAVDPYCKLNPGVYLVVGSSDNMLYKKKVVVQ
ncbi:MAG: T9SS type A sorting domain-containing protein, partial [Flavobacteriales bacterium]|nr:T9SS type A sorting domain-containing protein [Flavobacteriales bacterium]